MNAAILTVGDELLAGDVENTNATWLASRLADRGVVVGEIRVVPDDAALIATAVREFTDRFDATIVTGGLGSTPDDVTLEGVARAFDVSLERDDEVRSAVEATVSDIRDEYPQFEFDLEEAARYPSEGRIVPNEEGIAPGWVIANVYIVPGLPAEMKATFGAIVDEFDGERRTETVYSSEPESHLNELLETVRDRFDVTVGCYPGADRKRITLSSDDADRLEQATDWMTSRSEIDATE
ncbi:competence/damage-inducible protein A [Haloterrigena turkmenica]|nr:molybdopterin-binding protein [Haloterrigena turkmenica]